MPAFPRPGDVKQRPCNQRRPSNPAQVTNVHRHHSIPSWTRSQTSREVLAAIRKCSLVWCLISLAPPIMAGPSPGFPSLGVGVRAGGEGVVGVVAEVAKQHLAGCLLMILTQDYHSSTLSQVLRGLWGRAYDGSVVAGVDRASLLARTLTTLPCRALVVLPPGTDDEGTNTDTTTATTTIPVASDDTSTASTVNATDILSVVAGEEWTPETRVVVVGGGGGGAWHTLSHPGLLDSPHALYLDPRPHCSPGAGGGGCGEVGVYGRCQYCRGGATGVVLRGTWRPNSGLTTHTFFFPEVTSLGGHQLRVVAKEIFPYVCLQETGPPYPTLHPCDSLDVRTLDTASRHLNFTYRVRRPLDGRWGAWMGDRWDGMVGELRQGEADMTLRLFWSASRKGAIDFTRAYIFEPFVLVTRRPGPLPQHLAPVRPLTGEVWAAVVAATTAAGVMLWAVQWAWGRLMGGRGVGVGLASSILAAWGMLLQNPPSAHPAHTPGQVAVGWWWVFCLVVVATYRGSLIAHLTAPVSPTPINTLAELRAVEGATWGLSGRGIGWDWFRYNTNPDVQKMFNGMQVTPSGEQLTKVLDGPHAFFNWKYSIQSIIALHHTDEDGNTKYHIGTQELFLGQSGWGVRKNAPFLKLLNRVIEGLVEGGLIEYWLSDLFHTFLANSRRERRTRRRQQQKETETGGGLGDLSDTEDGATTGQVLGLRHLQSAFFLLLGGYCVSFLAYIGEWSLFKVREARFKSFI